MYQNRRNASRKKSVGRHARWDRIIGALIILVGIIFAIVMLIHHVGHKTEIAATKSSRIPDHSAYYNEAIRPEIDQTQSMNLNTDSNSLKLLAGTDISKHNGEITTDGDFVIIKATEGVGYVDPRFYENLENALEQGQLVGVYHFARPDTNLPTVEAEHFVNIIRPYIGQVMLVLDWEIFEEIDNTAWASAWLWQVYKMTGVRPILYTSASVAAGYDWTGISSQFDLWVACYVQDSAEIPKQTIEKFDLSDWNTVIWQYSTAGNLDRNVSSLTTEQWQERCTVNDKRLDSEDLMVTLQTMNMAQ